MVNKQFSFDEIPTIDDGWWESVLAEDTGKRINKKIPGHIDGHDKLSKGLNWERACNIFNQDQIIIMLVTSFNKGGLLADQDGIHGFIPSSHLVDLSPQMTKEERERCLSAYVGKKLSLKIIECVPDEGRLVFSERAAKTEPGRRTELMENLQIGQKVSGEVTNITDFGVFVDLGGVEGLIHISELSWGRVNHPSQMLKIGQNVDVLILEILPERCRVALSLKRLVSNPWDGVESKYRKNQIVPVVITSLTSFGAFARVGEDLEGLIHSTEIPLSPNTTIKDVLHPGDEVMVKIMKVDISRQRLGLSLNLDQ
jgi:small subunit ribosomal protein S1